LNEQTRVELLCEDNSGLTTKEDCSNNKEEMRGRNNAAQNKKEVESYQNDRRIREQRKQQKTLFADLRSVGVVGLLRLLVQLCIVLDIIFGLRHKNGVFRVHSLVLNLFEFLLDVTIATGQYVL